MLKRSPLHHPLQAAQPLRSADRMVAAMQPPTATRPQLQAITKRTDDIDEQLRQAAHIIGLPDGWESLYGDARSAAVQRLVRARADWVLRWILSMWKDGADDGARARANVQAWRLVDCMIHALPVSRCAPHLRDAQFLTILENTLEGFGTDVTLHPAPVSRESHPRGVSESSETVQEDPAPSRKRKRDLGTSTPSKRAAVEAAASAQLFAAVRAVVGSVRDKASQSEHMQMCLRTESAQAARILKYWLYIVQKLVIAAASSAESDYADLSLVIDIWELRTIDPEDESGASSEHFSTECLVPALILSQTLQLPKHADRHALVALERLLAKHVLGPSRTAFFNRPSTDVEGHGQQSLPKAELLCSSLEPLRAKLLQAAQMEDSGESVPAYLSSLFSAVPQLLDLVVRYSPARTPKSKIVDKSWVQAAFVALAECVGCSLKAPEFTTSERSIDALQKSLRSMASHHVTLDSEILRDLFWFHSGLKFPLRRKRIIHWPLIAALTELDPDIFLPDFLHKPSAPGSNDKPQDLATFLFDHISGDLLGSCSVVVGGMAADGEEEFVEESQETKGFTSESTVRKIILPIMSAFARNRNLRGFIDRWNHQLSNSSQVFRHTMEELGPPIWGHRSLISAFVSVFETSLTPVAITNLLQEYVRHLEAQSKSHGSTTKEPLGTDIIVQAVLQAVKSYENIEALEPQLRSLWSLYSSRALSGENISTSGLVLTWIILWQLLLHLWPITLHGSASLQKQLLYPLVDQAASDVTFTQNDVTRRRVGSSSRAAALRFLFTVCDSLRSIPGTDDLIRRALHKALKAMSAENLTGNELVNTIKIFCAGHIQLLDVLNLDTSQAAVFSLLSTVSGFDGGTKELIAGSFSQSVFENGSKPLQAAFTSACLEALATDDENLRSTSVSCFLQATPSSISREQRENVLDSILATLDSRQGYEIVLLSIVAHFMEVSNATAKISSDAVALFNLAQRLRDAELESRSALQILQSLAQSVLTHILPNKDQAQNKRFLEKYETKIASAMKRSYKCFPAKLAVLRGTFLAAFGDDGLILVDRYVAFLTACLDNETVPAEYILNAFNEIPSQAFQSKADLFQSTRASLRGWLTSKLPSDQHSVIIGPASYNVFPTQLWPAILVTIVKYQLYPDTKWLANAASNLLRENLPAKDKSAILGCIREALQPLESRQKLQMLVSCVSGSSGDDPTVLGRLINVLVSIVEDKQEAKPELKVQQLALLPKLCSLLGESPDDASFNAFIDSITIILRDKHSFTTQYSIECVLAVLLKFSSGSSPRLSAEHAPTIFAHLCATTRLILLLHRGRLGGRFHLLLPLLQNLLMCLFIPNGRGSAHPPWLDSTSANPIRLTPQNASQYTRLLSTLCSPMQSSVQRLHHSSRSQASKSKKDLNDPVRTAREYASQYVYPLLSSYCRFQLYGRLEPQVRDNLMAGIWEVVGVGCLDRGSLDSMFSGLGRSERDVWKDVWREWERADRRREVRRGD